MSPRIDATLLLLAAPAPRRLSFWVLVTFMLVSCNLTSNPSAASAKLDASLPRNHPTQSRVRGSSSLDPSDQAVQAPSASPARRTANRPKPKPPHYPYQDPLPDPSSSTGTESTRIANLYPADCRAELARRKLPFQRAYGPGRGIATPLRLTGKLHGVRFITPGKKSIYGKLDCRMALVLDDFAKLLDSLGVVAVHVNNLYRPHAHLAGGHKPSQHSYGLAADIYGFTLADGRTLVVERDFHGTIGDSPCGPDAQIDSPDPNSIDLRNLVCAVARAHLFHYLLTPCYDRPHKNHVHADIKRGSKSYVIR